MADFSPPKAEASKAKGSLPRDNSSEHQAPPVIHLEHHHLAKLGLKKMPPVGSKIKISGLAHVGATSENQDSMAPAGRPMGSGASTPRRSMTLHLHSMEMGKNGISDNDQEESQKEGMKGEIDKALAKGAGSESKDGKKSSKSSTPRGNNGPG
jgi:hypothetical protein